MYQKSTNLENNTFHRKLRSLLKSYTHTVYDSTSSFPREELFGITSQLRRASLSILLNYVEGYARFRKNVTKNFLEISYGSLQESKLLTEFSFERKYLNEPEYRKLKELEEEIGAMLWGTLSKFD